MQQVGEYETLHFSCAALIWKTWEIFNIYFHITQIFGIKQIM